MRNERFAEKEESNARPSPHTSCHGSHEGVPSFETVESRLRLENHRRLIARFVNGPAHHGDGDDREGDGFSEEDGSKLAWVDEAERDCVETKSAASQGEAG